MSHDAYIGLGSNLGDREGNLSEALRLLGETPGMEVVAVSGRHETAPVGGPPDQPPYLNAAARLRTSLSPEDLLDRLQEVESSLARKRTVRWGPRTIDLDLLLYDQEAICTDRLQVPHPRMHHRPFVLVPLAEIAPNAHHPTTHKTVAELLADLPAQQA
jgi:2-amino-4-hydroxy-6-hydroxymethyldihydropteridine diphosphokinase